MKQPEVGREWAQRLTRVIADALRQARGKRISAQQLSDRCAELGYPIPRSTISNLEIGRKETISIHEVLVLAKALEIPPLQLVFPVGREPVVEILPGTEIPTWVAAQWFTGEADLTPGRFERWSEAAPAYFRGQDDLYAQWDWARHRVEEARSRGGDVEYLEERLRSVEDQLRRHRQVMRRVGLDPGGLPVELAHVDRAAD